MNFSARRAMTRVSTVLLALIGSVAVSPGVSRAEEAPEPDEGALGTVVVTGGAAAALPKLAVMPLVTTSDADTTLQLVVRNDLDLAGQFDVLPDSVAPAGLMVHETAVDVQQWRAKGASIVVRVLANRTGVGAYEVVGEAYLVDRGPAPVFSRKLSTTDAHARETAHRLADGLLEALSGRPGGFASHLVYSSRVGSHRQVFTIDADGFNLASASPEGDTAICPAFGPKGEVYYAISRSYSAFGLARGPSASPVKVPVAGSIYGLSFSPDRTKMALSIASDAGARIYTGPADGSALTPVSSAPLANHPVFGPGGKLAYVAGGEKGQRVYVDNRAVSPAGFNASAPVFCDTPNGVLVVFTVGVGHGADLVATDVRGGNLMRLTQGQGANSYPACSPDGRLLAFFSTRKNGPGLYIVPLANLGHARKISGEVGESLQWDALP